MRIVQIDAAVGVAGRQGGVQVRYAVARVVDDAGVIQESVHCARTCALLHAVAGKVPPGAS